MPMSLIWTQRLNNLCNLVLENTEGQNSFCSLENQIIREIPAIFNSSTLLSKEFIKSGQIILKYSF